MSNKASLLASAAVLAASFAATGALAASVNHFTDNSAAFTTTGVASFSTGANDMNGMLITGVFDGGATQTLTFNNGTTGAGDFGVSMSGTSTFSSPFNITVGTGTLLSLFFQGAPGATVFDILPPNPVTPGTAEGRDFEINGPSPDGEINVTYSNPVGVGANAPLNDLYASMFVDFSGLLSGGLNAGTSLSFIQDTDNSASRAPIVPVDPVPLPAAGWLMLAGLGGLVAARRKKKA